MAASGCSAPSSSRLPRRGGEVSRAAAGAAPAAAHGGLPSARPAAAHGAGQGRGGAPPPPTPSLPFPLPLALLYRLDSVSWYSEVGRA